jgi:hypothetical protein
MDFMKWLSSLDELLFEVTSWLAFFPLTLWRAAVRPLRMMDYADHQLTLPEDEQYAGALSPPLFLALALLGGHAVATGLGQADLLVANNRGLSGLVSDQSSALIVRLIVFGAFPLLMSARYIRLRGLAFDRPSLRAPFYAQCYPTGVFAFAFTAGVGLTSTQSPNARTAGAILICASILVYGVVETRWFADKLQIGALRAAGAAMLGLLEGFVVMLAMGFLFSR